MHGEASAEAVGTPVGDDGARAASWSAASCLLDMAEEVPMTIDIVAGPLECICASPYLPVESHRLPLHSSAPMAYAHQHIQIYKEGNDFSLPATDYTHVYRHK